MAVCRSSAEKDLQLRRKPGAKLVGDVTTDRVGGFERTAIFMCEPGETQLLCPVEIAFLSSSAGWLRDIRRQRLFQCPLLSPLGSISPSPQYLLKVAHSCFSCGISRLPWRHPVLDGLAETRNTALLRPHSLRALKRQGPHSGALL